MTDIIIASDVRAQQIDAHLENLQMAIRAWRQGGAMVVPKAIYMRLRVTADCIEEIATGGTHPIASGPNGAGPSR